MKKKLLDFFKKRYIIIAFTVLITFFVTRQIYYRVPINQMIAFENYYNEDNFDLKSIPSGIVISMIGITSTYDSLLTSMPYEAIFHEFEVSILNPKTRVIHLVIVPLYAISSFVLGMPVLNGTEEQYKKPQPPQFKKPNFNNS